MKLSPALSEWLNLLARWFHVFAGILWIGTTYYFTWLDARLSEAERERGEGAGAQVWMVHSGGFYVVDKRKQPGTEPLHWFRWEAALTWLSGVFLLVLVYYLGGALTDPDTSERLIRKLAHAPGGDFISTHYEGFAIAVSVAALVVGWIVYDLLAHTPLGKNDFAFAAVTYALVVAASFGLSRVLSGRATYIQIGAMFGTIMAANVWMRILPAQRKMIAATSRGEKLDAKLGARAKQRSKHNTFMVVPAVFTMISNHFPSATYGREDNWLVLSILILAGWLAARFIRRA
ncbi:MAG: urate hydroxylase PuuD [Acidobacteria bacterium]|nr:urate hydroxylase PuuD [Acidobacteriota bacterium]